MTESQPAAGASYIHGHHPSVITSHSRRTLQNSASYLIPHLTPYKTSNAPTALLDAGCGPGTITCDLAAYLPNTQVTGIDYVLLPDGAPLAASRGLKNVTFQEADVFHLPFENNTFDIIHLHQVLQHLPTPPTAAIKELLRVCKPGGIIAAREADFGGFTWFPESEEMDRWREVYISTAKYSGSDPFAGRKLQRWFMDCGVERKDIVCTSSCWTYSAPEEREWWGKMWAERTLKSSFAELAVKSGAVKEQGELEGVSRGFEKWVEAEDGWMMVPSGEIVVRVVKG
ncbi:hypothetical protein TWF281_009968 [Arthrobotrys megalospora]